MKRIKIKNPTRLHRILRTVRIITTIEGLYILLVPNIWELMDRHVSKTWAIVNLVLGVLFTIISEVVIQLMQSVTFKNHQLIKDARILKDELN